MNVPSIDLSLLTLGFIFTFLIPGYLIIETFFADLPFLPKMPLYLFISILISTYSVYIAAWGLGFSRGSILFVMLFFLIWLLFFLIRKKTVLGRGVLHTLKIHKAAILVALGIFMLFLISLYPAIFSSYNNYFVMSAVNWQDTAMHLSIMESISQGNFPPQAPYFSGHPLNYYYFIDLHAAILQTLYGQFLPRIFVYDNPFFVLMFFLAVYALCWEFFKSRLTGVLAGVVAIFSGNFLYIKFIEDMFKNFNFSNIGDMLANRSYTLDYGNLMQMTTMADYFLQNRPMMIGLPAVALLIFLIKKGFEKDNQKYLILSGFLTALLSKFQLFAFGISILTFMLSWLFFSRKIKRLFTFFIPFSLILVLNVLLFTDTFVFRTFLDNFRFGVWDLTKDFSWYLEFPFANFGIPFSLFILFSLLAIFKRVTSNKDTVFLWILATLLLLFPYLIFFTIYDGDMLKFFYYSLIPISLLSAVVLKKVWYDLRLGPVIVILLILIASFNSLLTLSWSFFNKYEGYSSAEYEAGLWVRNGTPPKSVFITLPTVHSAVSDIGGRLRVLSYITWPYSHGFNRGADNVFTRDRDIENYYENPADREEAEKIFNLYNVNYIYLGSEEKNKFPFAKKSLDDQKYLKLVYDSLDIQIYKLVL